MPRSNSVIRRYTPPTCTLEVLAQNSPLSRWMGKTVLKQITFELHFDDPRLPEERRVPIRGDRDQLEALCDAVTTYVQKFLQQPPESFWVSFSGSLEPNQAAAESELNEFPHASTSEKPLKLAATQIPADTIRLESSSYLSHKLFLGSLSNSVSGSVIQLSLLQLFDLATALDEYSADVLALPNLNSSSSVRQFPAWAPLAAVFVLGVGLLPVTLQYANSTKQKQQQTATTAAPTQEKVALQPSPSSNFLTPQPRLTPPDTLPSIPPLGLTPPLPDSSSPQSPLPSPNSAFTPSAKTAPVDPLISQATQATQKPIFSTNQKLPTSSKQASSPTTIAVNPQANRQSIVGMERPSSKGSASTNIATLPPPLAAIPNPPQRIISPDTYARMKEPILNGDISPALGNAAGTTNERSLVDRLRGTKKAPVSTEVATGTLFDTPQVAEAREYLKKRWQPPAGLTQTLEYSVMLGVDGSIERILPLNQAARQYVDSAGIPQIGQPFVSANKNGQNVRVRVVLSPDGKVQTFLESQ
jgi:hypothetical protein